MEARSADQFDLDRTRWAGCGVFSGALLSAVTLISLDKDGYLEEITKPLHQILVVHVTDKTAIHDSDTGRPNLTRISHSVEIL